MTFAVIPVSEARRVTRVVLADLAQGRLYEILEPEGMPVRTHPSEDLQGMSLADEDTLRAAVEDVLSNSTRAQAVWTELSHFEDIAEAAAEADHLLAPRGMVMRELGDDERTWRSQVTRQQHEIKVCARALQSTPVNEIAHLSVEIAKLTSRTESLIEQFFERPLRPRVKADIEAELTRVMPETQLRDLDLEREAVTALALKGVFTIGDIQAVDQEELSALVGTRAMRAIRAALRSADHDSSTDEEIWSVLPSPVRKVLEEAGYGSIASLETVPRSRIEGLAGLGSKRMTALDEWMRIHGVVFAAPVQGASAGTGSSGEARGTTTVRRGTVKWFDYSKGYGFIALDGGDADIHVAYDAIQNPSRRGLEKNDRLEFEVIEGRRGLTAWNVRRL